MDYQEMLDKKIREMVHRMYWEYDANCARTTLYCMSNLLQIPIEKQTFAAAVGMHGAGGFRAQCGLVEGGLMFLGILYDYLGKDEVKAVEACRQYAEQFQKEFGSLRCRELRPGGFSENDPPHLCEDLTCRAITFTYHFAVACCS